MSTYRQRHQEPKSGVVVAVGLVFVLIAGGVLYGAYRWVKRRDTAAATPAAPVDEVGLRQVEAPFDNVLIDDVTNAFVMVVEVPVLPDADSLQRVADAVSECLAFDTEGLYPEAAGRTKVVRVLFHFLPDRRVLSRLPLDQVQVWVYGVDQVVRPLSEEEVRRTLESKLPVPVPEPEPEPEPVPEPQRPAPVKIDMVLENPETGAIVLVLVQDEPWSDEATKTVRRRVDEYFDAVESGALEELKAGEKYEIHVHCRERPGPEVLAALGRTYRVLKSEDVRFRVYLVGAGAAEEIPVGR
jgi:hypothetical protein